MYDPNPSKIFVQTLIVDKYDTHNCTRNFNSGLWYSHSKLYIRIHPDLIQNIVIFVIAGNTKIVPRMILVVREKLKWSRESF